MLGRLLAEWGEAPAGCLFLLPLWHPNLDARAAADSEVDLVKTIDPRQEMPPVRRLTAILAADLAGYSRLMRADEEGTHERLKAHAARRAAGRRSFPGEPRRCGYSALPPKRPACPSSAGMAVFPVAKAHFPSGTPRVRARGCAEREMPGARSASASLAASNP